jgi:23S rRNA (cytidine2498-2'-O)-methyltransferase
MHIFFWAEDSENDLRAELASAWPNAPAETCHPGLLQTEFDRPTQTPAPLLAYARQWLPFARALRAESIRGWASLVVESVAGILPDNQPWSLHIEPHYGNRATHRIGARAWHSAQRTGVQRRASPEENQPGVDAAAGKQRCRLIREAVANILQRKRRHLLRQLRRDPAPFLPAESLVQLVLTSPETGFLSVAQSPLPFDQRHFMSPFPLGEITPASDKAAPSRAFAKLVEAELRLGQAIQPGETCADLGASPGSWTYVAVNRGARVFSVDRSPLRDDLMRSRQVSFTQGDAFRFKPAQPVDWLLCDVIAAPERSADLLVDWLRQGWCRRFVVSIKLGDAPGGDVVAGLKRRLPPLTSELRLVRLCANKKELCAFGEAVKSFELHPQ